MRASLRSIAFIWENRSETTQLIAREFGMDREIAGMAYKQLLDLLSQNGKIRIDGVQLMVDMVRTAQKVDRPIGASELVDTTLLDEVSREGSPRR